MAPIQATRSLRIRARSLAHGGLRSAEGHIEERPLEAGASPAVRECMLPCRRDALASTSEGLRPEKNSERERERNNGKAVRSDGPETPEMSVLRDRNAAEISAGTVHHSGREGSHPLSRAGPN